MSVNCEQPALQITGVSHRYGEREALNGVSFEVLPGGIFGLLGPNGGGKTTLFRILSTLLPLQTGSVSVFGLDLSREQAAVRSLIGVTFQSPSLDRRLTVFENLKHQGHLYGLQGAPLHSRIDLLLDRLGVADRRRDRVESLSGGLQRRVEVAKSLLHDPELLLLDEPSTGLDPGARRDLWDYLTALRIDTGVTILVTTHLMDEAERCDGLGILDRGRLVALGSPNELRSSIGGDCLTIQADEPEFLSRRIAERFAVQPRVLGDAVRIERDRGHELLRDLIEAFPEEIRGVALGKPTLEDVFIQRTGRQFWEGETP